MQRSAPVPKPNLMIVDDDPDQLRLFRITAERTGRFWRIATAEDGDEAFDQILKWADELPRFIPQIVVTDMKMPKMNGIEFARRLRTEPRLPPLHLVAMSSSGYEPDVRAALDAGCEAFVQKPGEFSKLKEFFLALADLCVDHSERTIPSVESVSPFPTFAAQT
jgi:CheY-like chemotaxis protein